MTEQPSPSKTPTLWQVVGSVAAAMFGVQSERNRKRDLQHGKFWQFAVISAVMVLIFILVLVVGVHYIIAAAGN